MSTTHSVENFEEYRLSVGTHEGYSLQLVSDDNSGISHWQKWKRKRKLGQGGFGEVWQEVWEDEHGDSHYRAVKIRSEARMRADHIDYRRELSALAAFSRSKWCASLFVNMHGWWMEAGNLCVATEYLGNGDLSRYATHEMSETEIKEIAEDVLQGLSVMHSEGFTHRDMKPQNILVVQKRPEFRRWWVKIADFGISKQILADSQTTLHTTVGTRPYCAPEILGFLERLQETSVYSSKVDMWSFGCVLFNLGSRGQLAFSEIDLMRYCDGRLSFNPRNLQIHLSNAGVSLMKDLLQIDPERRPKATEALQHSWLTVETGKSAGDYVQLPSRPQPDLQNNFNSFLDSTASKNSTIAQPITRTTIEIAKDTTGRNFAAPHAFYRLGEWLKENENLLQKGRAEEEMPAHLAAEQGQLEVLEALQEVGADIDKMSRSGWTPLSRAVEEGHLEVVKWLSEKGANIDVQNTDGHAPLHIAAWNGYFEVAKWLVENGAATELKNQHNATPLYIAARGGHLEVVKWLSKNGASIDVQDTEGWSPLHIAAWEGHLEVVKWLVENGAAIEPKITSGATPLYVAAQNGHLEVVKWLVENGAAIEPKITSGATPLYIAAQNGHLEAVKWLSEKGASIDAQDTDDNTPLFIAAHEGRLEVVKWLVENGAAIELKTTSGATSLYIAAESGHLEVVKWLVQKGANIYVQYTEGWGLLHIAARNGYLEVVKWLVENGAPVESKYKSGATPLYVAVVCGHLEVVKWLVQKGANTNVRDSTGDTMLSKAENYGHEEVRDWLKEQSTEQQAAIDVSHPWQTQQHTSGSSRWTKMFSLRSK